MREMKQVVQGDGGCPVPRNMQGQDGWDLEQPDLVKDVYIYIFNIGKDVFSIMQS